MNKKKEEITLKDIFEIFKPKLWLILLVAIVFSVGAFVYSSYMKEEKYTSTGMIYVYSESSSSLTTNELNTAKSMSETYRIIITNRTYLKRVANELKAQYPEKYGNTNISISALKSMLSVASVEDTQIIKISITSTDKEFAFDVAKAIVDVAPDQFDKAIPNAMSVTTIEYPEIATAYNSKNVVRNTVVAFLAGFLIMAVALWVYAMFDVTIHDLQELEAAVDVPVLGIIPKHNIPGEHANVAKEDGTV